MREVQKQQMDLGAVGIADIELDLKSRDDIPAILLGLQHLYSNQETRTVLFALLEEHIGPGTDRHVGRPGMALWRLSVVFYETRRSRTRRRYFQSLRSTRLGFEG